MYERIKTKSFTKKSFFFLLMQLFLLDYIFTSEKPVSTLQKQDNYPDPSPISPLESSLTE